MLLPAARDTLSVMPEFVSAGRAEVRMQVVKTKGEVGTDGRLRLDLPVELPAGSQGTALVPWALVVSREKPAAKRTCRGYPLFGHCDTPRSDLDCELVAMLIALRNSRVSA